MNILINTRERTVYIITDSLGMRIGVAGRTEPNAKTHGLVLGDSFMEALQVEYRDGFPELLEAALTRQLHRPVSVWDAGVDDWDPEQYLIRMLQLLGKQDPMPSSSPSISATTS